MVLKMRDHRVERSLWSRPPPVVGLRLCIRAQVGAQQRHPNSIAPAAGRADLARGAPPATMGPRLAEKGTTRLEFSAPLSRKILAFSNRAPEKVVPTSPNAS